MYVFLSFFFSSFFFSLNRAFQRSIYISHYTGLPTSIEQHFRCLHGRKTMFIGRANRVSRAMENPVKRGCFASEKTVTECKLGRNGYRPKRTRVNWNINNCKGIFRFSFTNERFQILPEDTMRNLRHLL